MRIIYSIDYPEGGTFNVATPIAEELRRLGHEVRVVYRAENDAFTDEEIETYDLVHAWNSRSGLRFRFQLPMVQTINSFYPSDAALYRDCARAATLVHVHSPYVAQFLYMHDQVPCTFIPSAFDPKRCEPQDIPLPETFTLGWLGGNKGIKRFEMARRIADKAEVPYVEWDVDETLHPWEEVKAKFFPAISCYLLASWNDAGPLPQQEALAFGRPVITTAVGQTCMIVRDGVNGIIFDGSEDMGVLAVKEMQKRFRHYQVGALATELPKPADLVPQYMRLYARALRA